MGMRDLDVTMPDGRIVGVVDYGVRGQTPVIWCHGGPGCRLEPAYFAEDAARVGLRLIGIDRPGYGRSTPQPGRTINGWVDDALTVADRLGLERFAALGVSTGGAYALATAAASPRVLGAVACCAVTDMRWKEGKAMMPANHRIWSAASRDAACEIAAEMLGVDGAQVANIDIMAPLAPSDAELFTDPEWQRYWAEMVRQMVAQGVVGYADDRIADGSGWHTFDVRKIECPVVVLHGASDTFAPVAHARYTQRLVPRASLDVREGLGHFSIFSAVIEVLDRLLESRRRVPASRTRATGATRRRSAR